MSPESKGARRMAIQEEVYRGLTIRVGCFELVGRDCFITSLLICRTSSQAVLVDLPVTHLVFRDGTRALESTIVHGRLLVDMLVSEATAQLPASRSSRNREQGERRKIRGIETLDEHHKQAKPV